MGINSDWNVFIMNQTFFIGIYSPFRVRNRMGLYFSFMMKKKMIFFIKNKECNIGTYQKRF